MVVMAFVLVGCGTTSHPPDRTPDLPIIRHDAGEDMSFDDAGDELDECVRKPKAVVMKFVQDGTHIDIGTSGLSYDIARMKESFVALEVVDCEADCNRCTFRGPIRSPEGANMQRCVSNTSTECTSDEDCGGSSCAFFLGSHSVSKLADGLDIDNSLLVQFLDLPGEDHWAIRGDIDFTTGEVNVLRANFRFHQWVQSIPFGMPSPGCVGDDTPNDGVRKGNCQYAASAGKCDVNGKPGRGTKTVQRDTSLDCPLSGLGTGFTYFDLNLGPLKTGISSMTLTAQSPNALGGGGRKAWCAVCADGTPCSQHRDCDGIGVSHQCGEGGTSAKDACWKPTFFDPDYESSCTATIANPNRGVCGTYNPLTPAPQCHPGRGVPGAQLVTTGSQGLEDGEVRSVMSGVVCLPAGTNGSVNELVGLPGVGAMEIEISVKRYY